MTCFSGVALSFIFHVLWFITVFVCVCACLCVCFMSMGFMPEINSCYAMLKDKATDLTRVAWWSCRRALDLRRTGREFNSQPVSFHVT